MNDLTKHPVMVERKTTFHEFCPQCHQRKLLERYANYQGRLIPVCVPCWEDLPND